MVTPTHVVRFVRHLDAVQDAQLAVKDEIRLYRAVLKAIVGRNCTDPAALCREALKARRFDFDTLNLET